MNQQFDYYGQPELPYIILCNPNREELFSLGLAYETNITLRFNAMSEFSFVFPKSIDAMQTIIPAYEYIQNKRIVLVEGYGYFLIVDVEEANDGSTPIKKVTCNSLEAELIQKKVVVYGGTKKLYDIITPDDTILDDMVGRAPTWSVGTVDAELLVKQRTFDVSDSNIYNFLMEDVATAFECVFVFDTLTKTINAYALSNATVQTDIFLSFNNIISTSNFAERSDEITTCMAVYGGGDLNIRSVNPLGTDKIYDFTYYKTTDWMSQSLVNAITAWEAIVESNRTAYANLFTQLKGYRAEKLTLQAQLEVYKAELLALEGVQKARIQAGQTYADILVQITAKRAQITSQNTLLANKQTQINTTLTSLTTINTAVSFASNFTPQQLEDLSSFIYENTYKNENIIITDIMTDVEVQDQEEKLYEQAKSVLSRVSLPRYEIQLDAANYIALEEFEVFTNQTEVGAVVTAEIKDGIYAEVVLLEMSFNFDSPTNFSMTFSNRLRLDGQDYIYSDLMGEVQKTGASVAFDSAGWSNWNDEYKDDVSTFITSSLNTAVNNLISNSNQEILIDQNGLRGRSFITATGQYDNKQVWLTNNVLAFSDNGFQTAKLALGQITTPSGGTAYGLVGDVIVGRILAGNTLTIANSNNSFTLDGSGATLTNAKFTVNTTNSKIIIDPTSTIPFRIQKNQGGTFVDKFFVSNAGDVTFSGNLTGATGTFSGTLSATVGNIGTLVIDSLGLKTSDGTNYLRGDGSLKWGGLSISGSSATFNGTIFANKLSGQIENEKIASGLDAGKVTFGGMSGNRISGGTPAINGLSVLGGTLVISGNLIVSGFTQIIDAMSVQSLTSSGTVAASGFRAGGSTGVTVGYAVTTPYGTRYLYFRGGILYSFT
jgi:hypothetical protein